jgi:hypothetical protein
MTNMASESDSDDSDAYNGEECEDSSFRIMNFICTNVKKDYTLFILGIISGASLKYELGASALLFGVNLLTSKYASNATDKNMIVLFYYTVFFVLYMTQYMSYKILPLCEVGFTLYKCILNCEIDAMSAALFSVSLICVMQESRFAIYVVYLHCFYNWLMSLQNFPQKYIGTLLRMLLYVYRKVKRSS